MCSCLRRSAIEQTEKILHLGKDALSNLLLPSPPPHVRVASVRALIAGGRCSWNTSDCGGEEKKEASKKEKEQQEESSNQTKSISSSRRN